MAEQSRIAWTKSTFNGWQGCTKVSPGCQNCYASVSTPVRAQGIKWGPGEPRKRTSEAYWRQPLRWNKQAESAGEFWPVFCSSLADVFDNEVPDQWRDDLFDLIEQTPHLTWQLLTKRIGNAKDMLPGRWTYRSDNPVLTGGMMPANIWIGATIVNQEEAGRDIPKLLVTPAAKRFVSYEPALEAVDWCEALGIWWNSTTQAFVREDVRRPDWIIVGGESDQPGMKARPFDVEWARSTVRQCKVAGVACFVKQLGSHAGWDGTGAPPSLRVQGSRLDCRIAALEMAPQHERPRRRGSRRVARGSAGAGVSTMKERPILFSAPMVRALLGGTKTQTRRICKLDVRASMPEPEWQSMLKCCPYGQPGDRLLVASEIPGVGRTYCAGTDGAIYSRARGAWRPLKAHLNDNGYPCVTVMLESRKTTRAVHSLVCAAFYGPPPFDGAQVRHLDGDRQHSSPENLCWGTQAENWQDRRTHGNGIEGEKHHAAKLTNDERAHLRWAIERGLCSQRHAARALGMTQGAVGQVMEAVELRVTEPLDAGLRIPRVTLEVTGVRVERLDQLSEANAVAEGCAADQRLRGDDDMAVHDAMLCMERETSCMRVDYAIARYMVLWEQINGPGSWAANPWVWCVEFKLASLNAPGQARRQASPGSQGSAATEG